MFTSSQRGPLRSTGSSNLAILMNGPCMVPGAVTIYSCTYPLQLDSSRGTAYHARPITLPTMLRHDLLVVWYST